MKQFINDNGYLLGVLYILSMVGTKLLSLLTARIFNKLSGDQYVLIKDYEKDRKSCDACGINTQQFVLKLDYDKDQQINSDQHDKVNESINNHTLVLIMVAQKLGISIKDIKAILG